MNRLRRILAAVGWTVLLALLMLLFPLMFVLSCIADLPGPDTWLATRRFRAEKRRQAAARARTVEEVRGL